MFIILLDNIDIVDIVRFSITLGLVSQPLSKLGSFPTMDPKATRTMDFYMGRPQGQVTSILRRSDPVDIPGRRIQLEPVTFGSVPLKRLADFEDNDMPMENPSLERQSR